VIDTSNIVRLTYKAVLMKGYDLRPHLTGRALAFVFNLDPSYKSQEFFQATVEHLIVQVYSGNMGGDFIGIMYSLISGQLYDAYTQAWHDDGNALDMPDYLLSAEQNAVVTQQDYVQAFYNDIVDARVDQTGAPTDRAVLWANRWNEAYNDAMHQIALNTGGKEEWQLGSTEDHCPTCEALNGVVAYASEWEEAGVHTQGAPNDKLSCGGWRCDCSRVPTEKRKSPNALDTILNAVMSV
jgi:hypothetical protein